MPSKGVQIMRLDCDRATVYHELMQWERPRQPQIWSVEQTSWWRTHVNFAISSASEHLSAAKVAWQIASVTLNYLIKAFFKIFSLEWAVIDFKAQWVCPGSPWNAILTVESEGNDNEIMSEWPKDSLTVGWNWNDSDDGLWKYNNGLLCSRLRYVHSCHIHLFVAHSLSLFGAAYHFQNCVLRRPGIDPL